MQIFVVIVRTAKTSASILGPACLMLLILLFGVQVDGYSVARVCGLALPALALIGGAVLFILCRHASLFAKLVFLLLLAPMLYNTYTATQIDIHYINHPYFIQLIEAKPWLHFLLAYAPLLPYSLLMGIAGSVSGEEEDHNLFDYSAMLYTLAFLLSMACGVFAYEATVDGTLFMSIFMALGWTLLGGLAFAVLQAVASLPYYLITWITGSR